MQACRCSIQFSRAKARAPTTATSNYARYLSDLQQALIRWSGDFQVPIFIIIPTHCHNFKTQSIEEMASGIFSDRDTCCSSRKLPRWSGLPSKSSRGFPGAQLSTAYAQVKHWRRDLHKWDPEVAEDEEVVEVSPTCFDMWTSLCLHSFSLCLCPTLVSATQFPSCA